ncbi:MAG TPA: oligosaccharide flippase family protein [Steroidobacteraceae bacterium]|nr:oligosaccharide flippase family protein [Steroidobacteraceae bacterium]
MKVLTNAAWLSLSRASTDALSFVLFTVVARTFGPAGSGEYSYAFASGMLFALFATCGLEEFGIRQYARAGAADRPRLWADLLTTQAVQLLLGTLAFALLGITGVLHPTRWVVVLEIATYLAGWMIARTLFVPAMAAQSMVTPAVTDLSCRLAGILCALVLALGLQLPLPGLLIGFPVAGIALVALAMRNASRHGAALRLSPSWSGVAATARGIAPFAGVDLLGQFYARTDLLLIAYFLGNADVGLYATDIKFVEVGLLPLFMLGSAAYPLLSRHAGHDTGAFTRCARDLVRIVFFCAGWLAVGIFSLVPLLLVPLFGEKFRAAASLVPWIAILAVTKGVETGLYRVLYAARRQTLYFVGLSIGTALIVALNIVLIPSFGLGGAVLAALISTASVDVVCVVGLTRHFGPVFLPWALARLMLATVGSAVAVLLLQHTALNPWLTAAIGCGIYPIAGVLLGLMPDPRHSHLFRQPDLAAH